MKTLRLKVDVILGEDTRLLYGNKFICDALAHIVGNQFVAMTKGTRPAVLVNVVAPSVIFPGAGPKGWTMTAFVLIGIAIGLLIAAEIVLRS